MKADGRTPPSPGPFKAGPMTGATPGLFSTTWAIRAFSTPSVSRFLARLSGQRAHGLGPERSSGFCTDETEPVALIDLSEASPRSRIYSGGATSRGPKRCVRRSAVKGKISRVRLLLGCLHLPGTARALDIAGLSPGRSDELKAHRVTLSTACSHGHTPRF